MDLPLQPGNLSDPECWTTPQALYDEMFAKGVAISPDITGILIQDAAPDPIYRGSKGWIATSGNVPIYPLNTVMIWHAVYGHWVARHPTPASAPVIQLYYGTAASIDTYDFGEAGVAAPASGPFWKIKATLAGRAPVGVGIIPTSAPAASIVNPLDTSDSLGGSGEYKHVLVEAEGALGSHKHPMGISNPVGDDAYFSYVGAPVATANYNAKYITGGNGINIVAETTADLFTLPPNNGNGVVSAGHNNMQPYFGIYYIERTIREFYRAG